MKQVVKDIKTGLASVFNELLRWFEVDKELGNKSPADGGWTINLILEHVYLTNYYLLILIRKAARKALEKARKQPVEFEADYQINWDKLKAVGEHWSFVWNRPEHMEPTGKADLTELKQLLTDQLEECLALLDQLPDGEGTLYSTTMSVNELGKIDVYHYLLFLSQHIKRHLQQMETIKSETE